MIGPRPHAKVVECLGCGSCRIMGHDTRGDRFGTECSCGTVGWVIGPVDQVVRIINGDLDLLRELFPGPVIL